MARVFLLSVTPADDQTDYNLAPLHDLQRCAELDRVRAHSVTSDPAEANLIIFAEAYGGGWYFERVRRHALVRRYREKCFLFTTNPLVIPFLPGVYAGVEKEWASPRTRTGFYLGRTQNEFITYTAPAAELPYLFSFMGSIRNAPIREKLAGVRHPRSFFQDTTPEYDLVLQRKMDRPERMEYHRRYAELIQASKFVLCPRGVSPSSIRLFETMRMGRVPVILSDGWVPMTGPDWDRFAIRVRERDFARIPQILEAREAEAVEMGELARKEWERWFSDEILFHHLVELCLDIQKTRRIPESLGRWTAFWQVFEPFHLRRTIGAAWRGLRRLMARPGASPKTCEQQ